jgi:hypothetical protein
MGKRTALGLVVLLLAGQAGCGRKAEPSETGSTSPRQAPVATGATGTTASTGATGATTAPSTSAGGSATEPASAAPPTADAGGPASDAGAATGGEVSPSELEYAEMKVTVDQTTGDPKEDNWRFIHVWGELKNKSSHWVQGISGDIRYFDPEGKELRIQSIASASKQDVGDSSPGERIDAEVMYVAPGASVPMHHTRALAKLGGKYGSYKIALRPAHIVTQYPEGVLEGLQDEVAIVPNETLESPTPLEHRVLAGTIRNKGTLGCRAPGLVVGYYDASGKLADLSDGNVKGDSGVVLAPGGTMPVKVYTLVGFDDAWKAKATIKTWVRCSEPFH